MQLDHKDTAFSFKRRRIRKRRRILKLLVALSLLVMLAVISTHWLGLIQVKKSFELSLQARFDEAGQATGFFSGSPFFRRERQELRVLASLATENREAGNTLLEAIPVPGRFLDHDRILSFFLDRGDYLSLAAWLKHIENRDSDFTIMNRAIVETAFFNPQTSRQHLADLSQNGRNKYHRFLNLLEKANLGLENDHLDFVFDRNGRPLAYFKATSEMIQGVLPGFSFEPFKNELKSGLKFYSLSLDLRIQELVHKLFGNMNGTFVLLELTDAGIIACYSKSESGATSNAALEEPYQPASIIKVLSLLSHLRHGKKSTFPYDCRGNLVFDKKIFYDWITHGKVENPIEALAVSCNTAFAAMVAAAGEEKYQSLLKEFFFNSGDIDDLFFKIQCGSFAPGPRDSYDLANLAVGLREITVTTAHAALIASIIANSGSFSAPFLLQNTRNLLDISFYRRQSDFLSRIDDPDSFRIVRQAMEAVITDKRGTGRRADGSGVSVAAKTGTIGSQKNGFDAIIIGFFPVESPRYAFALRLQRAGKAELVGAPFLKRFLNEFSRL